MRRPTLPAAVLVLASTSAFGQAPPAQFPTQPAPHPPPPHPPPIFRVGDKAPDFTLPYLVAKPDGGFERKMVLLADYRGKQNVVLPEGPNPASYVLT